MCPGTTAHRRHTLKDQTDREEHCSTLWDLRLLLPKYHSHHGIVFVFVPARPSPGRYMFHLWDSTPELTLGNVHDGVWCGVTVFQDGMS
jgi:hypothetical protein